MFFGLFKRKRKTEYVFPAKIAARCHGCLNEARAICKANGIGVSEKSGKVMVITRDGVLRNKNGWSWHDPANDMQVMMLTHGEGDHHVIEIATTPGDITTGWENKALTHEFCHVLTEKAGIPAGHDPRLKGKVFGWH